tara:strand:+ start:2120 stop:2977 length:858 start_codon:yes stop_codon:yes gene_type:complete
MEGAPWRIFNTDSGDLVIDVDGKITIGGVTSAPFPSEVSHAAMCDKGIVATWVEHELRLARMALLSTSDPIENGISKAELRLSRNTAMVAGSTWCHIVDAEPLALTAKDDKIIFALWTRGIYCIDSNDNEIWRLPLFDSDDKSPPRSEDVTSIHIIEEEVYAWTRGGKYRIISLNEGEILDEKSLEVECDLEVVFSHGNKFLLSSKDGWVWEIENGEITVARKLRGTIQDAVFDGEDWRIISWREDIMLRGESVSRDDLGVQILNHDGDWMVIDNQGEITPHMGG